MFVRLTCAGRTDHSGTRRAETPLAAAAVSRWATPGREPKSLAEKRRWRRRDQLNSSAPAALWRRQGPLRPTDGARPAAARAETNQKIMAAETAPTTPPQTEPATTRTPSSARTPTTRLCRRSSSEKPRGERERGVLMRSASSRTTTTTRHRSSRPTRSRRRTARAALSRAENNTTPRARTRSEAFGLFAQDNRGGRRADPATGQAWQPPLGNVAERRRRDAKSSWSAPAKSGTRRSSPRTTTSPGTPHSKRRRSAARRRKEEAASAAAAEAAVGRGGAGPRPARLLRQRSPAAGRRREADGGLLVTCSVRAARRDEGKTFAAPSVALRRSADGEGEGGAREAL